MRVILFLFIAFSVGAQDVKEFLEVGVSANAYKGDLSSSYEKWSSSFHLAYKTNHNKRINFRINGSVGTITGQNPNYLFLADGGNITTPNKYFKTSVVSANADVTVNLLKVKSFIVYVSQGLGFMKFNPKDADNNSLVNNFSTREENESYSTTSLMLPSNLGAFYTFLNGYGAGIQVGFQNPLTDYLDNISGWSNGRRKDNILMYKFSFYAPLSFKSGKKSDKPEVKPKTSNVVPPAVKDNDFDGIENEKDKCPDQTGPAANNGCPVLDSDHDGIVDNEDNCPTEPGDRANKGCPAQDQKSDSDGDGIDDEHDTCPDVFGVLQNHGCPELKQEDIVIIDKVKETLIFETGKAGILPVSYPALDDFANKLSIDPTATIRIEGHTDHTGDEQINIKLSKDRAEAVKAYLANKGISEARIIAEGFGSSRPLESNDTEEGKAKNRRVEIVIVYGE